MRKYVDRSRFRVEPKLINPNADHNARRLMKYICDIYGKNILSGQQSSGSKSTEIEFIHHNTGVYPAVRGFDMMDFSPSRLPFGASCDETQTAVRWWKEGGIVTFCWHWNAPKDLINEPPDKLWYSGFYTKATTFDVKAAMDDPASEEYGLLLRDIDAIAKQLKLLQHEGVPVLWRPLHEAAGAWFWWGAKGPEPCIKLWKLIYDRMTRLHELNNLIWVWNGQHGDWYPGDDYVDMIGEDVYAGGRVTTSQIGRFEGALSYTKANKIIALTENGTIPDPDNLVAEEAAWVWFCTWCSRVSNEEHNELSMVQKAFHHPYVINRGQLPDLSHYPLDED